MTATEMLTTVRIAKITMIHGQLHHPDAVLKLLPHHAQRLVREGTAEYCTRVRALRDDLVAEGVVHAAGDVFGLADDRAEVLAAEGVVAIVTRAPEYAPEVVPAQPPAGLALVR